VLYGSGGCSLYDAARLHALGGVDEAYEPAYVEDLDLGYRAWQRGWPSVYVAGAVVEHRHRATTSRYYTHEQLDEVLEVNYLKFLVRAVASPKLFRQLWRQATRRLQASVRLGLLRTAVRMALGGGPPGVPEYSEELILALNSGAVAVFPGQVASGRQRALIISRYLPHPLTDSDAFQMYNLMRRVATDFDLVLVALTKRLATPPPEILANSVEVVLVLEDAASPAFRAALHQTVRKWRPAVAHLEGPQMAQYAADCAPARAILVEPGTT
jgi:hypothetical protein